MTMGRGFITNVTVRLDHTLRTAAARRRAQLGHAIVESSTTWSACMITVEIWSDIACPWCYIGKRRFEQALGQFEHRDDVDVVWRSFEPAPNAPRNAGMPQEELLAKKYGMPIEQARAMNARMTAEASKEGLEFHVDRVQ